MTRQALAPSPPVKRQQQQQPLFVAEKPIETVGRGRKEGSSTVRGKDAAAVAPVPAARPKTKRVGEVAGGTTAECAAVCCCCPCALMNLLVLAVVKVPAYLCRKAKRRRQLQKKKKQQQALLLAPANGSVGVASPISREELDKEVREIVLKGRNPNGNGNGNGNGRGGIDGDGETVAVDLEKQMWDQFYGTGFWRSSSQRAT